MASVRKSRSLNKRFVKLNEESSSKVAGVVKSKNRKRKLSDMLGSQWSKEELERFYEAYRKYGKDWKKVAGAVRNRTVDMVEALYNMNKAYLSLADGMASAAGLIAMITDYYNNLEASDTDHDENPPVSRSSIKSQKRGHGKFRNSISKGKTGSSDPIEHQDAPASHGCLGLLSKRHLGGCQPRAVGKRTPRFPVSYASEKHGGDFIISPLRHESKIERDSDDDEGIHVAALALAEASQRGGSPQVSRTPGSRVDVHGSDRKYYEPEIANSKYSDTNINEECPEGSLGSREAENVDFIKDFGHQRDTKSSGKVAMKRKARKSKGKKSSFGSKQEYNDDAREACSGTEEGRYVKNVKEEEGTTEMSDENGVLSSRKSNRKLFFGDDNIEFGALQTLADLSLNYLASSSAIESESSSLVKEGRKNVDSVEKSDLSARTLKDSPREKVKSKDVILLGSTGADVEQKTSKSNKMSTLDGNLSPLFKQDMCNKGKKRKRKTSEDVPLSGGPVDGCLEESHKIESSSENGKKPGMKIKRSTLLLLPPKPSKLTRQLEFSSSGPDLGKTAPSVDDLLPHKSGTNEVNVSAKSKSRHKIYLQKAMAANHMDSSECYGESNLWLTEMKMLSHCLSSPLVHRWCTFEWFYSSIDYPWFAKSEFVEYLNHVGLGHVPRLTRVEWGVIRSSLGKPRRLSHHFLQEERIKLEQYRESVRTHYSDLRAGTRDGLPADLARPLSVGQRVIAIHPKTRDIHDGNILTVDRNRCRVQFDRPELGVEFVLDIDCMPLNPLENMPDVLRKPKIVTERLYESPIDPKLYGQSKDWKFRSPALLNSHDDPENGEAMTRFVSHPMSTLMKQAKNDTIDAVVQAKAAANEVAIATRHAMYTQPCTIAQIQAKEDDIRALAELTRALDKKEALLVELWHMNEDVSAKQKEGDSIKDSESFRKQYAMVLLQLRDANDLVASALLFLRQRNTHIGNSTPPSRPVENSTMGAGAPEAFSESAFYGRDSGTHVMEIIESSRRNARNMVDIAMQAMSSVKEGEDAFTKVGEALDSVGQLIIGADFEASFVRKFLHSNDQGSANLMCTEPVTSCILEPKLCNGYDHEVKQSDSPAKNIPQIPSELITSCVSTLLMIQRCTEKQYPPAEVAQILESAVQSLMPCCPQNMPIYRDIEICMGVIKNQMLALVPSTTAVSLEPTVA